MPSGQHILGDRSGGPGVFRFSSLSGFQETGEAVLVFSGFRVFGFSRDWSGGPAVFGFSSFREAGQAALVFSGFRVSWAGLPGKDAR